MSADAGLLVLNGQTRHEQSLLMCLSLKFGSKHIVS